MSLSKKKILLSPAAEYAIAFAFEANPNSLPGKLQAIYEAASALIFYSEQMHKVKIKKAWGVNAAVLDKQSLDIRVARRKSFINTTKSGVLSEYEAMLGCLGEIVQAFNTIGVLNPSDPESTSLEGKLHRLWQGQGTIPAQELNILVPSFFSLQLRCWLLYGYLGRPGLTYLATQERAKAGGVVSNAGEEILRKRVLGYLESLTSDKTWKSFSKFLNDNSKQLTDILEDFQASLPEPPPGRNLTAFRRLKGENMDRKLREWVEDDPEFLKELQRLIPSYRRAG